MYYIEQAAHLSRHLIRRHTQHPAHFLRMVNGASTDVHFHICEAGDVLRSSKALSSFLHFIFRLFAKRVIMEINDHRFHVWIAEQVVPSYHTPEPAAFFFRQTNNNEFYFRII